jgi:voltage-dependent calcium channel L type alpha-1D
MGKKGRVYAAGEEDYEVLCNTPSTSPMASSSIPSSREGVATKGEDHLLEGNMGRKSRTSNASMGGGDPHAHDDELVTKSLWLFTRDNSARIFFMALLKTTWFDKCILATILLNSISLAMVDYSDVDDDYNPIAAGSWRNTLVNYLEPFFTCIFTLEAITKIVALGFTVYIRDGWNRLDFLVVVAGAMELLPGVPKLSMLRTFRILRPLRSLSKFPGLRRVITAMLNSLPGLMDVVLLLCFVLAIFSILGIQFFMGILHSRCRLTPYPVRMAECTSVDAPCWNSYLQEVVADPLSHACLVDSSGQPVPNDSSSWTRKGSSPWAETQDCVWPIDNDDMRICSQFSGGWHQCKAWDDRTCGSDYDSLGNSRFWTVDTPYGFDRMKSGTYYEDLNWGFTNFDNFVAAILSIFQSVTMEGWSTIMYMCMDAYNPIAAAIVFVSVIVLGSFVMLNLVLAVITESISDADETARQEAEAKRQAKIDAGQSLTQRVVPKFPEPKRWQLPLLALIHNSLWSKIIMGFIIANTVVLASDRYPISPEEVRRLETANLVFTIVFAFEMVINMLALGLRQYVSDPFNNFDFVIVVTSLIELTVSAFTDGSGSGGISALRAFRLFRVFKLAKRWKDLQELLAAMQRTVLQVGNFAVLLFLFIFIYALVGLQFFSNRLHFNPQTGAPVSITSPQYASGEIPRANFDTFIWSMVTVFQVLTGENWNSVMYDCWRATSWIAPVYFLSLVILGGFIVMNIFLAILLSNFEGNEDLIPAPEKQSSSERVARVGSAIRFMHRLKEGGIARIRGEKKDESGEAAPLKSESVRDDPESSLTDSESLLGCEDADQARETAGSSRESSEDMDDYVMGNGLLPPAGKRHSASSAVYKAAQVAHNMGRRVSLASHTLVNGIAEVESKVNNQMETAQEDSRSLWMFSTNSSFRSLCTKIVAQKNFENGIL